MEQPFVLLTQDNCPNCEQLKKMLSAPLRGAFDDKIEVLHRQQNPEGFLAVSSQYGAMTTPALIDRRSGALLSNLGLGEVKRFLSQ